MSIEQDFVDKFLNDLKEHIKIAGELQAAADSCAKMIDELMLEIQEKDAKIRELEYIVERRRNILG